LSKTTLPLNRLIPKSCGRQSIAGLYEFAPDAEGVDNGEVEAPAENGQPELELAEA